MQPEPTALAIMSRPARIVTLILFLSSIGAVTILSPGAGLAILTAAALLEAAGSRFGAARLRRSAGAATTGAIIGWALGLFPYLPAGWNWLLSPLILLCGLAIQGTLEHRTAARRPCASGRATSGETRIADTPPSLQDLDIDDGQSDRGPMTPEGARIRILGDYEYHFGYVYAHDYLLPDGTLLAGWGTSTAFSPDGRYFAAACDRDGIDLLDRTTHRTYHDASCSMYQLQSFSRGVLRGTSGRSDQGDVEVALQDILLHGKAIDLIPVVDLWISAERLQQLRAPRDAVLPDSPLGRHQISVQERQPESLRALRDPLQPLRHPRLELCIDGHPSGYLVDVDSLIWRPDGEALCCYARAIGDTGGAALMVWHSTDGWRALPAVATWMGVDPASSSHALGVWHGGAPVGLGPDTLRVQSHLSMPLFSQGDHGVFHGTTPGPSETVVARTPDGRMQVGPLDVTHFLIELPLAGPCDRSRVAVLSAPLEGGHRLRMTWCSTRSDGIERWACTIGDWQLPGHYWLDHRVAADGRQVALVPVPEDDAPLSSVVVADVARRRMLHSPASIVTRLLDFRDDVLTYAAVDGRLTDGATSTALRRFDQLAPAPSDSIAFLMPHPGSALYYGVHRLQVTAGGLQPLASQRLVDEPQSIVTADDYLLPAPSGEDAAWIFGATTQYEDAWLRPNEARHHAFLMTASGCALGGLSPCAMWSSDSRYLLLARQLPSQTGIPNPWHLLLLDTVQACLYTPEPAIGMRPRFISFHGDDIFLFVHARDRIIEGDLGRPRHLALRTLMQAPSTPLESYDTLKLAPDQFGNVDLWLALDRAPLHPWMHPQRLLER